MYIQSNESSSNNLTILLDETFSIEINEPNELNETNKPISLSSESDKSDFETIILHSVSLDAVKIDIDSNLESNVNKHLTKEEIIVKLQRHECMKILVTIALCIPFVTVAIVIFCIYIPRINA